MDRIVHYKKKAIFMLLILAATVWLGVDIYNKIAYMGQNVANPNTIVVSGTGYVYASPDLAETTVSVATEASTVAQAMSDNTNKMNAIISYLKDTEGVAAEDLQTTGFNISPRYEYYDSAGNYLPQGKRILAGYDVTQSLDVKIRDLTKVGTIIQGVTDKGANQVGSLQFTIDNQDSLKDQARAKAIDQAKTKAQELASQLGVKLNKIINFSESSVLPVIYSTSMQAVPAAGGGATPTVEPGQNKIQVSVNVTYEIN